jgi:hypothetical protein
MKKDPKTTTAIPMFWSAVSVLAAFLIAAMPSPTEAQSPRDVQLLTPRQVQRLSEEAREPYRLAVDALDHINPIKAIEQMDRASSLDPNSVELHFLAARLAHLRGRMVFGEEAEKYYEMSERALERIGQIENLTPLLKHRYRTQLEQIRAEKKELEVRRQRRMAIGEQFRKIWAMERYNLNAEGEEIKPEPQARPQPQPAGQQRGRPGARPARPMRPVRPRGGGGGADTES